MQSHEVLQVLFKFSQLHTRCAHSDFPTLSERLSEIGRPAIDTNKFRNSGDRVRKTLMVVSPDLALPATNAPRQARCLHDLLIDLMRGSDEKLCAEAAMLLNFDLASSPSMLDARFSDLEVIDEAG